MRWKALNFLFSKHSFFKKHINGVRRYLGLSALHYHADLTYSLTNHTVIFLRDFLEVFVDFGEAGNIFKTFAKIN